MQSNRGHSYSVIGALDGAVKLVHHMVLPHTTNKISFTEFISGLIGKLHGDKSHVVLDNINFHHSFEVQDMLSRAGVEVHYLPPYSCALNPIESYWSTVKARWKKFLLTKNTEEIKHSDIIEILENILQGVEGDKARAHTKQSYPYMLKSLRAAVLV